MKHPGNWKVRLMVWLRMVEDLANRMLGYQLDKVRIAGSSEPNSTIIHYIRKEVADGL